MMELEKVEGNAQDQELEFLMFDVYAVDELGEGSRGTRWLGRATWKLLCIFAAHLLFFFIFFDMWAVEKAHQRASIIILYDFQFQLSITIKSHKSLYISKTRVHKSFP